MCGARGVAVAALRTRVAGRGWSRPVELCRVCVGLHWACRGCNLGVFSAVISAVRSFATRPSRSVRFLGFPGLFGAAQLGRARGGRHCWLCRSSRSFIAAMSLCVLRVLGQRGRWAARVGWV